MVSPLSRHPSQSLVHCCSYLAMLYCVEAQPGYGRLLYETGDRLPHVLTALASVQTGLVHRRDQGAQLHVGRYKRTP